jgi:hypothetical protein
VPGREAPARSGSSRETGGRTADRGWDDLSLPGRDERGSRNSGPHRRRDFDDGADDLIAASATPALGTSGRSGKRTDDLDDARTGMATREYSRPGQDGRSADGRSAGSRDSSARDDRERRGNSGPNARPDSRKGGPSQGKRDDSLPDVRPRPSRGKRDDDGEWPSTEWDELSDVDYWAELASDKPLTTAVPASPAAAPARSERDESEPRSLTDSGSRRLDRRDRSDRRDQGERGSADRAMTDRAMTDRAMTDRGVPDRGSLDRALPERALPERGTPDRGADRRDQPLLPAARASRSAGDAFAGGSDIGEPGFSGRTEQFGATELRRSIASGEPLRPSAASRGSGTGPRPVQAADDDPLTSPSFPRITDDSRSYRRSRSESNSGSHSLARPEADDVSSARPPVGYQAVPPLPSPADLLPPVPSGYSRSARSGDYAAAPAEVYSQPVSAPAMDSYRTETYSVPAGNAAASYEAATPAGGFMPPGGIGYLPDAATAAYSTPHPSSASYHQELPPASGYAASPLSYPAGPETTGYHGATAGHAYPPPVVPAAPAEQGYVPYAAVPVGGHDPAQPLAPHFPVQPPVDPAYPGLPQPSHQAGAYGDYQAPVPADRTNVYQVPGLQPAAPVPAANGGIGEFDSQPYASAPYPSASYEPAGYPPGAYEPDGASYPADPYAVDPYGYPGYGSARLSEPPWPAQRLPGEGWQSPGPQPWHHEGWRPQDWHDQTRRAESWPPPTPGEPYQAEQFQVGQFAGEPPRAEGQGPDEGQDWGGQPWEGLS